MIAAYYANTGKAAATTAKETTVRVTLKEWSVEPNATSVPAGKVKFEAVNAGTMDHELVVIKTDLAAGKFNLTSDGTKVDEPGSGQVMGTIRSIGKGDTGSDTYEMPAGHYALLCNVAGHYRLGMHSDFQVT